LRDHCCTEGNRQGYRETERGREREGRERDGERGGVERNKSERKEYKKKQNVYCIQQ